MDETVGILQRHFGAKGDPVSKSFYWDLYEVSRQAIVSHAQVNKVGGTGQLRDVAYYSLEGAGINLFFGRVDLEVYGAMSVGIWCRDRVPSRHIALLPERQLSSGSLAREYLARSGLRLLAKGNGRMTDRGFDINGVCFNLLGDIDVCGRTTYLYVARISEDDNTPSSVYRAEPSFGFVPPLSSGRAMA